jgi:hypothetical protein
MKQVVKATATCEYCDWTRTFSGTNFLALAHHVRDSIIDHIREMHPEKLGVLKK